MAAAVRLSHVSTPGVVFLQIIADRRYRRFCLPSIPLLWAHPRVNSAAPVIFRGLCGIVENPG